MSQMSYIHKPCDSPMDCRLLHQHLESMAGQYADTEALVFYDMNKKRTPLTYRDFNDKSIHLASSLLDLGLSRGQRVLLIGASSPQYLVFLMALHRIGAQAIMLGPGGLTEDKVKLLTRLNLSMVAFDPAMQDSQKQQLIQGTKELVKRTTEDQCSLDAIVTMGDSESALPDFPFLDEGKLHSYDGLLILGSEKKKFDELEEAQRLVQFDDPIIAISTSGSTGQPKLVQLTMHSLVNTVSEKQRAQFLQVGFKLKYFLDRPFAWTGGYIAAMLPALSLITMVVVPTEMSLSEDNEACFQIIEQENCGMVLTGTALIHKLIKKSLHTKYNLDRKMYILTGQRYPQSLVASLYEVLPNSSFLLAYVAAESVKIADAWYFTAEAFRESYSKLNVSAGVELKIVDASNKVVPRGQAGEICTRNAYVFLGYLDNPEATKQAKSPTGWLHTGDIGIMDDKGRIKVEGRKTEIIKRATVKIFPADIEKIILEHPSVADAVVIGIPDQRLHEEICACVVFHSGSSVEARLGELEKWCQQQWPPGADGLSLTPKHFLHMESFPLLTAGKIDRRGLRGFALEKLGIKVEISKSSIE